MDIIPHDIISLPGIYRITCLSTGKIYIGQSGNLSLRLRGHQVHLQSGIHPNKHLQYAWNKYGADDFVFEIIEFCDESQLTGSEQYWLDILQPFEKRGFNSNRIAEKPPSSKGVKRSAETKAKLSAIFKGRYFSPETRAKMSASQIGKSRGNNTPEHCERISRGLAGLKKTPEHVEKMAQTKRKKYIVISPDGQEIPIEGMRLFCRQYNLNDAAMIRVAQGRQKAHKGWKCSYA